MDASSLDRLIRVVISPDHLTACVVIDPGVDPAFLSEELVGSLLDQQAVRRTPARDEAVAALVRAVRAAPGAPARAVVAEGTPAVHGAAGRFELADSAAAGPAAAAPAAGTDHYNRSAFRVVKAGELVGRLTPPVEGRDGVDVTGRTLVARPGVPAPVRLDESVSLGDDGAVRAARAGMVCFKEGCLRILEALQVEGYVDFSTGNIDFPGHVHVAKGIRDCFVVKAGRSLSVHDLVEAADVEVGEDAVLDRGMAAREKGSLKVGRDLHAKYLDNVQVSAGRDVLIAKEVANCQLWAGRRFIGPSCSVVGGELGAMEVEAVQLGTIAGVTTHVVLGRVPALEAQARRLISAVLPMRKRVEVMREKLETLRRGGGRRTASQAEELTELQFELSTQQARLAKLMHGLEGYLAAIASYMKGRLTVHRQVCAGVRIWLGSHRVEIHTEVAGPVTFSVDARGFPVVTRGGTATPASRVARVVADDRFVDIGRTRQECELPLAA